MELRRAATVPPFCCCDIIYDRLVAAVEQHGWREVAGLSYTALKTAAQDAVSNAADNSARAYKVRKNILCSLSAPKLTRTGANNPLTVGDPHSHCDTHPAARVRPDVTRVF